MTESSPKELNTPWEKKKLFINLRAISPFSIEFSNHFCCRHVKTRACSGKGHPNTANSLPNDKILDWSKLKDLQMTKQM